MRRYYDWATAYDRRLWWTRWLLMLPLLGVFPLLSAAAAAIAWLRLSDGAERMVRLAALAPIPLWFGYTSWRLLVELAPFWRTTWASWRNGWRAAWAAVRRGGKPR